MRFSKIAINDRRVELVQEDTDSKTGAIKETKLTSPERPMAGFDDAVQAFKAYVTGLLPFKVKDEHLKVTTLNLSDSKDGRRGLQVSCNVALPKCSDKVVSITTPLVLEAGETSTGESFVLSTDHMKLIALAEEEATRYLNGERMQLALALDEDKKPASKKAKAFDERAAAAEAATTRKPGKNRKPKDHIPGVGTVVNPGVTEILSDAGLRNLLLMVERDVAIDQIVAWTSSERNLAEAWARARQKELAGQLDALKPAERKLAVPMEPECVAKAANAPLTADAWTDPNPPRVSDDGQQAILAAAEKGA